MLVPGVARSWCADTVDHGAISTGLRHTALTAYIGCNYAECVHLDKVEYGPTVALRCSRCNPKSLTAHIFIYSDMMCNGKCVVMIEQPVGAVTVWKATEHWHTSSVDEPAYLKSLQGISDDNDPLSLGLVVVQKTKLLTIPSARQDVISWLYSVAVLRAYYSAEMFEEEVSSSEKEVDRK